ncbi:hypothetical protein Phum_PHUM492410 [Pediculus humanus corporis]|uniref:Uncharacterized protein n=1 Tax=Pediculus humanus subsp. corporis TaxID=121224 RepID=E0VX06_PEDHC|nr:uncharacterized protein Phum_PHUM492410 [Pediculus humanus corporis]EEB17912.1 hypothetical protein Phum_PHUM492410 [Pediculus humanus corporis]
MADIGPNLVMPDERAAGVISGSDPYRELELYLEKVNISYISLTCLWKQGNECEQKKIFFFFCVFCERANG